LPAYPVHLYFIEKIKTDEGNRAHVDHTSRYVGLDMSYDRSRAVRVLLGAALFICFASASMGQEDPGAKAFQRVCAGCHGADAMGGDPGPPLIPFQHQGPGLVSIARAGKGEMAPLPRKQITDDEILAVATYLATLSAGGR